MYSQLRNCIFRIPNNYFYNAVFPATGCVLRNFAKFSGKHLCRSLFVNKATGQPATLLKKRLWHKCFPVNFAKFLRTPFLQNTSGRLLLNKGFFKIASNKSVRTACVCIVFFFHCFEYHGQNIFSRKQCFI